MDVDFGKGLDQESTECHAGTLEEVGKSKMAAKMATK